MKIAIAGCSGRMGRMLVRQALSEGVTLAAASERAGSPAIGKDAALLAGVEPCGVVVTADSEALFKADAVVDFTAPESTLAHAALAAQTKKPLIVGTTGLSAAHEKTLRECAQKTTIVWSANMSLGVNILTAMTEHVAALLGEDFDIEILEMHHRHKVDAPSGTALALGQAAAKGRKTSLEAAAVRARDGVTGPRKPGAIGFAALRGGDVVGDHSVIFAGDGERIELTHKASSRRIYATGALRAARWAQGKPAGLYTMKDVLGL